MAESGAYLIDDPVLVHCDDDTDYPTTDGRYMPDGQDHADERSSAIATIGYRYANDPMVYVWGDLLMFYERGNKRKHVSPDVLVSMGIPKLPHRDQYLMWREKVPDLTVEIASRSTHKRDTGRKKLLYEKLGVREYIQFDTRGEFLADPLQLHRLVNGRYRKVKRVDGRLYSEVLDAYLERDGTHLKFRDPATGELWLTPTEAAQRARDEAQIARDEALLARNAAELRLTAEAARRSTAESQLALAKSQAEAAQRTIAELLRRMGETPPA